MGAGPGEGLGRVVPATGAGRERTDGTRQILNSPAYPPAVHTAAMSTRAAGRLGPLLLAALAAVAHLVVGTIGAGAALFGWQA